MTTETIDEIPVTDDPEEPDAPVATEEPEPAKTDVPGEHEPDEDAHPEDQP